MNKKAFYFAQLTDIHIGQGLNPEEAAKNLTWALAELESLSLKPEIILATADLVCAGKRSELQEYSALVKGCQIPIYALPANHDLWGESDDDAWHEIIGPLRQGFSINDVHFLLWNETQRDANGGWVAELRKEQRGWFESELDAASGKPIVVAQHCPPLSANGNYHDRWNQSNADELLEILSQHNILAMLTGHWHRNGEWQAGGVQVINTGALAGWQWNATPPHYCFPLRPGYRLCYFDGENLRTFWRDGSYWNTPAPAVQVTLVSVSGAYTGGPRPQVRTIDVYATAKLEVVAYATDSEITKVEWSLTQGDWRPMTRTFDGLWSEWQAEIDPLEFRAMGEQICIVRAENTRGTKAYDAVPMRLAERECAPTVSSVASAGAEKVFELFYLPQ